MKIQIKAAFKHALTHIYVVSEQLKTPPLNSIESHIASCIQMPLNPL